MERYLIVEDDFHESRLCYNKENKEPCFSSRKLDPDIETVYFGEKNTASCYLANLLVEKPSFLLKHPVIVSSEDFENE